jgi:DNA-binding beta-propeller fold protein YncE/4-amino-4-deoxy-L-arabinose transferase-like glycosyltransferase
MAPSRIDEGSAVEDRGIVELDAPTAARPASVNRWLLAAGFLLWIGSCAAAFWAQYQIFPLQQLQQSLLFYVLAAALAIPALLLIERQVPLPETLPVAAPVSPWRSWRSFIALTWLAAGIFAAGMCVHVLLTSTAYHQALLYWIAGLGLIAAALVLGARRPFDLQLRPRSRSQWIELGIVLTIIALALALRLPHLEQIPPEVHGDEAACGLEARQILAGRVPNLFTVGWYHIPYLSFAISAASMWIFGDTLYGFRMASVIQGSLSVLLLYLLARRLFTVRVATLAAFLLAVSHWSVHFSRSGINYMQAQFATLLVLYFVVRAVQDRRAIDWLLAGYSAGLCFNVYYSARLAPVLAAAYLLHRILRERGFLRAHWPGMAACVLGAIIFLGPMGIVFSKSPKTLMSRTQMVFLFSEASLKHEFYTYRVDTIPEVLREQVERTLTAFNWRGETSLQHNHKAPLLDFWSSALLVVGVIGFSLRLLRSRYFLVAVWLWLTLIMGSVLTVDAMFSPRVIIVVPALFLFPALFIDAGWRAAGGLLGRFGGLAFALLVGAFLALSAQANYRDYFERHIHELQPAGINTILSRYIDGINDRYQIYLIGNLSLRYDTEHFLIPDVDGVDVRTAPLALPLRRIPAKKGVAFLVTYASEDAVARFRPIQEAYPNGRSSILKTAIGVPVFHVHIVEHDDLVAANPQAELEAKPMSAQPLAQAQARPAVPRRAGAARPRRPTPASRGTAWLAMPSTQEPRDVAVASDGSLFVIDRLLHEVHHYDAKGRLLGKITTGSDGPFDDPRGIALGPDGNVLVLESKRTLVQVLTRNGQLVKTIRLPGGYYPSNVDVDAAGSLYVADTGQSRVVRLDPDGKVTLIGRDAAPAALNQPTDVVPVPGGEMYVADSANQRVVVFGPDGKLRREWPVPPSATFPGPHLLVSEGSVFFSHPEGGRVLRYDLQGNLLAEIGAGSLMQPVGMATDEKGILYVVDATARGIFRYDVRQGQLPGK